MNKNWKLLMNVKKVGINVAKKGYKAVKTYMSNDVRSTRMQELMNQ